MAQKTEIDSPQFKKLVSIIVDPANQGKTLEEKFAMAGYSAKTALTWESRFPDLWEELGAAIISKTKSLYGVLSLPEYAAKLREAVLAGKPQAMNIYARLFLNITEKPDEDTEDLKGMSDEELDMIISSRKANSKMLGKVRRDGDLCLPANVKSPKQS